MFIGPFSQFQKILINVIDTMDSVTKYKPVFSNHKKILPVFSICKKILPDFSILMVCKAFFSDLNIFEILNISTLPQFLNSQGLKSHFLRYQQIQNYHFSTLKTPVFSHLSLTKG